MARESALLALVERLEEADESRERWESVLGDIAHLFGAMAVSVEACDFRRPAEMFRAATGMTPEIERLYAQCRSLREAALCESGSRWKGGAALAGEIAVGGCPEGARCRKRKNGPPCHGHYRIGSCLVREPALQLRLSVIRDARLERFADEDGELLVALARQAHRSLARARKLLSVQVSADGAWAALDRLPTGVALLDEGRRIGRMNAAAQRLIAARDGLTSEGGVLRAWKVEETAALQALVSTAAAWIAGDEPTGTLLVSRPSGERALHVFVSPLPLASGPPGRWPGEVAVFMIDPAEKPNPAPSILQRVYGLTPAEAKLAARLLTGKSVEEAARELGVAESTARTQLKSLFTKLDVRRQSDLVRLLLSGPAALRPTGVKSA
jgi:DNA-binding CsgD family transcriptional regulator